MKKKLILFDWGNIVESHTTGYNCYDAFNDTFRLCGYQGKEEVFHILGKYKICKIKSYEEFSKTYELIKKDLELDKSYEEFIKIYKETFSKIEYYPTVANYEHSLKDRCNIGIFSDLTIFDTERLDKQVDLSQYDYIFLSAITGFKKPDKEAYEYIQSQVPFAPQDILLIDDRKENIKTAIDMGWNAVQATGLELEKIKRKCEEFLAEA